MAIKYNRQSTNKYYGAANAGYVRTGSASDGLAKALASASQSVAIGENLRINNKKDKAIEKIQALEASGKTLEAIQGEILAGKHPDLTGKYIDATTQFHSGKIKAAEVIEQMTKAMETDYDITKDNLNDFSKQFLPDMEGQDSSFMAGFGSFYNVWKNDVDVQDAKKRGEIASQNKIDEVRQVLGRIPTKDLDTRYVEEWKSFGTVLRTSDNKELTKFYTNEELMEAIRQDVNSIIDTADSLEDIERAEKIMSLNLGQGTNGQDLGSLNSRKNRNTDVLKANLTARKDAVIQKERRDENYNTAKATQAVWVEAFTPNEDGTQKSTIQMEEIKRKLIIASKGDVNQIDALVKYFNSDPSSRQMQDPKKNNDFLLAISNGEFESHAEIMIEMAAQNIPQSLFPKINIRWDRYEAEFNAGALKPIYDVNHHYTTGKDSMIKEINQKYFLDDDGLGTREDATRDVLRYVEMAILDQEDEWREEGVKVTEPMRKKFIEETQDYVSKTWTGVAKEDGTYSPPNTVSPNQAKEIEIENERIEAEQIQIKEAQEKANNTVIMQRGGEPITLKDYVNEITQAFADVDIPRFPATIFSGIISEDEKYRQQTEPTLKKYIKEVIGTGFSQDVFNAMSNEDFDNIITTLGTNAKLFTGDENQDFYIRRNLEELLFNSYNIEG